MMIYYYYFCASEVRRACSPLLPQYVIPDTHFDRLSWSGELKNATRFSCDHGNRTHHVKIISHRSTKTPTLQYLDLEHNIDVYKRQPYHTTPLTKLPSTNYSPNTSLSSTKYLHLFITSIFNHYSTYFPHSYCVTITSQILHYFYSQQYYSL